jgi:hypothetical protein
MGPPLQENCLLFATWYFLVPKLRLGTNILSPSFAWTPLNQRILIIMEEKVAKQSFAPRRVPKQNLGTRVKDLPQRHKDTERHKDISFYFSVSLCVFVSLW